MRGRKMKQFTLYEAARYSGISRYKLERAIDDGILETIGGKGNIKCFILKEKLQQFIKDYGDQYVKEPPLVDQEPAHPTTEFVSKELHDKILSEKNRIIEILESQNQKILPLLDRVDQEKSDLIKTNEEKIKEIKSLVFEIIDSADLLEKKEAAPLVKKLMSLA